MIREDNWVPTYEGWLLYRKYSDLNEVRVCEKLSSVVPQYSAAQIASMLANPDSKQAKSYKAAQDAIKSMEDGVLSNVAFLLSYYSGMSSDDRVKADLVLGR